MPAIFTDRMVLQQNAEVKIWGTADAGLPVVLTASWAGGERQVVPDKSGTWSLLLQTLPADGKPCHLTISQGAEQRVITDILFGEVWLCTGQSNMEMKMKGYYGKPILGGPEAIANGANTQLRFFEVEKAFSPNEQADCKGKWLLATPATVANCSASAYYFGRQLQRTLGVPVALISAPWGGAAIEAFMSREALSAFPQRLIPKTKEEIKTPNKTPAVLFNGMINPIVGYALKGCIWYQGETNRSEPALYKQLYRAMLTDWRAKWGVGNFPVYYAQIAPFTYGDGNSAFMREAQAECEKEMENTGMITLLDVGEEWDIHPSNKEVVGFRFAVAALNRTYGVEGIASYGPTFKSMDTVKMKGKVILSFDHAEGGLTTYNQPLDQFMVAGADCVFYPAKADLSGATIIVGCEEVPHPVAVRYGFTDYVKGTLYNIEGQPASSFRTDRWDEKGTSVSTLDK